MSVCFPVILVPGFIFFLLHCRHSPKNFKKFVFLLCIIPYLLNYGSWPPGLNLAASSSEPSLGLMSLPPSSGSPRRWSWTSLRFQKLSETQICPCISHEASHSLPHRRISVRKGRGTSELTYDLMRRLFSRVCIVSYRLSEGDLHSGCGELTCASSPALPSSSTALPSLPLHSFFSPFLDFPEVIWFGVGEGFSLNFMLKTKTFWWHRLTHDPGEILPSRDLTSTWECSKYPGPLYCLIKFNQLEDSKYFFLK